jgi:hypothetical protein
VEPTDILQAVLAVLVIAATIGAAFAVMRAKGITAKNQELESSLSMFSLTNNEYREHIEFLNAERVREREEFFEKLHQQELTYSREIAELRGQISVYESGLAERLVGAVVKAISESSHSTNVIREVGP